MAWIESHQELSTHPKTRKLANRLDVSVATAIGHLHALWWWALVHAFDGDLTGWDSEDIALGALWEGDPETFIKGLLEATGKSGAGFLEQDGERLILHDWETYTSHLRARRESASKANHIRWHEKRNATDPSCEWCRNPNGDVSESERSPVGPESESTVPDLTVPDLTVPDLTKKTSSRGDEEFEAFWKSYPARRGVMKGSKKASLAVWKRLSPEDRKAAAEAVPAYESSQNGFTKDAERYLKHRAWEGINSNGRAREPEFPRL